MNLYAVNSGVIKMRVLQEPGGGRDCEVCLCGTLCHNRRESSRQAEAQHGQTNSCDWKAISRLFSSSHNTVSFMFFSVCDLYPFFVGSQSPGLDFGISIWSNRRLRYAVRVWGQSPP